MIEGWSIDHLAIMGHCTDAIRHFSFDGVEDSVRAYQRGLRIFACPYMDLQLDLLSVKFYGDAPVSGVPNMCWVRDK
jgi:hypothetical protein